MKQESPMIDQRFLFEQSQRLCMDLLHTDIDVGYAFLRLAATEYDRGAVEHAAELVGKASDAHQSVLEHLSGLPVGMERQRRETEHDAQELLKAITAALAGLRSTRP